MICNLLGKSSLQVSRIGFGGMSLEEGGEKILEAAVAQGINFFDTADIYHRGGNEEMFGRAFRGKREQVIIATKAGNQWRADGSGWNWNPRRNHILAAAEDSLRRLQTDYIDLFQLHGGTITDPIDETIGAFEQLKEQGKIRFYGISSIRPEVIREYVRRSSLVSVMMQYSLLDRRPEEEMLDFLHEHQVAVLTRGSLAKGLLVSKPEEAYLNYSPAEVGVAAKAVAAAGRPDREATGTALQYVLGHPAVRCAVVGIRTAAQLSQAIQAEAAVALLPDERRRLSSALPSNCYTEHR